MRCRGPTRLDPVLSVVLGQQTAPLPTCPACSAVLHRDDDGLRCPDCSATVPVEDGIARFPVPADATSGADGSSVADTFDALSSIYESPLWFRPLYRLLGGPSAPADDRQWLARSLGAEDVDVLDVACGTGRFTRHVARDAASVRGIDLSTGMLERARRSVDRRGLEHVQFARMSADDLHFADGAFDRVAVCWALHLFPDPGAALAEARRVVAEDGRIVGTTLVDEYVLRLPGVAFGARQALGARAFEAAELRSLLHNAGFDAVTCDRRGATLFFAADA